MNYKQNEKDMKKEEIYVKLTGKNREKVFKILDIFGQQLTKEDEVARKTGRYPNGTPIKYFPELEFKTGGTWILYQGYPSNTKTRIKPRELRNMLAQEHLKKGDVIVVGSGRSKWVAQLTGDKFDNHNPYCLGSEFPTLYWTIGGLNFLRYATEEECKLLKPVVFECASCEQELDVSQRSDDKPNLCNNCFKHAIISFEDRVWYKHKYTGFVANYVTDEVGYGINNKGLWENGIRMSDPTIWSKATPEEVERALLREAENRGLVAGCLTTSLDDGKKFIISERRHPLLSVNLEDKNMLWVTSDDGFGYCVFDNGKWAVPIDKFEGLQQAHKNGAIIQYRNRFHHSEWLDVVNNDPIWHEHDEYRIKPEEPKTSEDRKLARYGDVCKFYNTNPGVFVVGYLSHFGKSHNKKVYYCVGLDAPYNKAEPITKEEAIKLLFRKD